jgi:hypothetical protein
VSPFDPIIGICGFNAGRTGTGMVAVFQANSMTLTILRIFHTAQNWQQHLDFDPTETEAGHQELYPSTVVPNLSCGELLRHLRRLSEFSAFEIFAVFHIVTVP